MTVKPRRLGRSQLAVPGSYDKMLAKAAASNADHVFHDLEDSVAPRGKAMIMVARAAGLDAIDGPFANYKDPEARSIPRRSTPRSRPSRYAAAVAQDIGPVSVRGIMVDAASILILRDTITKADLMGLRNPVGSHQPARGDAA
jgi:hypothetical protein